MCVFDVFRGVCTLAVQVVVGILKACEKRLLAMTDMEKMVDFLRGEVPRWPHDKLQVPKLLPSLHLHLS